MIKSARNYSLLDRGLKLWLCKFNYVICYVANGEEEEEPDTGVTYFVDEEGHYYYQQSGEGIVSLPTGVIDESEVSL